jgi:hypothetical protein
MTEGTGLGDRRDECQCEEGCSGWHGGEVGLIMGRFWFVERGGVILRCS